jgi:hypothetical protein
MDVLHLSGAATPHGAGGKGSPSRGGVSLQSAFRADSVRDQFGPVPAIDDGQQPRGIPRPANLFERGYSGIVGGAGQIPEPGEGSQIEIGVETCGEGEVLLGEGELPVPSAKVSLDGVQAGAFFGR